MRRIVTLAAIAVAAVSLPLATVVAQTTVKAEGGTEGTGVKQSAEQPKFVKKTLEQKAANKAERKAVSATSQGGAPMSDASVAKPSAEHAVYVKKTPEQKAAAKAERKEMRKNIGEVTEGRSDK